MKGLRKSPWLLLAVFIMVLLFRLYSHHLDPDPRIRSQAGSQYWARLKVAAPRGFIRDRNGIALASPRPEFSLTHLGRATPPFYKLIPERLERISKRWRAVLSIARKVGPPISERIINLKLPGLFWVKRRDHPGNTLCHVWVCSIDDTGLAGTDYSGTVFFSRRGRKDHGKDARAISWA